MREETESGKKSSEKLLEAIGELPEEMVAEAADLVSVRRIYEKNRHRRILCVRGGLAAAALIGIVVWGIYVRDGAHSSIQKENLTEKKVVQEEMDIEEFGIRFLSVDAEKEMTEDKKVRKKSNGMDGVDRDSSGSSSKGVYKESMIPIYTSSSGRGKTKVVQAEMRLGDAGKDKSYHMIASGGIYFLEAAVLNKTGEKENEREILKETRKYQCLSGTQITFSLPVQEKSDTDISALIPAQIQALFEENGVKVVGYIQVWLEESTKEKKKGMIFFGKQRGKYYAVFFT